MHSTRPVIISNLTKSMLTSLIQIQENEKLKLPPLDAALTKSSKGLCLRRMVEVLPWKDQNNKQIMSLFITPKGRLYLEEYSKNKEIPRR